ncbi:hypothetical protein NPIL_491221 [Nephila pilipes]|uniref:Uncharacterized protein n=1 Tax=Nephila pilipes TaxID=299642 RepID=A0A8X6TDH6_NEPPI|nr:hypothetical protein NPIL_491221 [Nephila pilipes]
MPAGRLPWNYNGTLGFLGIDEIVSMGPRRTFSGRLSGFCWSRLFGPHPKGHPRQSLCGLQGLLLSDIFQHRRIRLSISGFVLSLWTLCSQRHEEDFLENVFGGGNGS